MFCFLQDSKSVKVSKDGSINIKIAVSNIMDKYNFMY